MWRSTVSASEPQPARGPGPAPLCSPLHPSAPMTHVPPSDRGNPVPAPVRAPARGAGLSTPPVTKRDLSAPCSLHLDLHPQPGWTPDPGGRKSDGGAVSGRLCPGVSQSLWLRACAHPCASASPPGGPAPSGASSASPPPTARWGCHSHPDLQGPRGGRGTRETWGSFTNDAHTGRPHLRLKDPAESQPPLVHALRGPQSALLPRVLPPRGGGLSPGWGHSPGASVLPHLLSFQVGPEAAVAGTLLSMTVVLGPSRA